MVDFAARVNYKRVYTIINVNGEGKMSNNETWLGWFFDVFQTDFGALPPLQKAKIAYEAKALTDPTGLKVQRPVPIIEPVAELDMATIQQFTDLGDVVKELEVALTRLKPRFFQIMENIRDLSGFLSDGCRNTPLGNTPFSSSTSPSVGAFQMQMDVSLEVQPVPVGGWRFAIPLPDLTVSLEFEPDTALNTPLRLRIKGATLEASLFFNFIRLLEGIPVGAFHKCPECRNWFIHTSKRKKVYCSNQCAARHITRRKRAAMSEVNGNNEKTTREGA
jgi:hypothetical protein